MKLYLPKMIIPLTVSPFIFEPNTGYTNTTFFSITINNLVLGHNYYLIELDSKGVGSYFPDCNSFNASSTSMVFSVQFFQIPEIYKIGILDFGIIY